MCSSGNASAVSGNGPWSWSCSGTNGGKDIITCSASRTSVGNFGAVEEVPQKPEPKAELKKQEEVDEKKSESAEQESKKPATESKEPIPAAKEVKKSQKLQSTKGVLSSFRDYKGSRSLKGFSELFENSDGKVAGIVQLPEIAVSDGKKVVTVSLDLPSETDSPSFSFRGANMKAIRRLSDIKWEVDALPQKGKSDVRLSIILKSEDIDVPLIVVPMLDKANAGFASLSVAELDAYLAKPLKNNKPQYDLNTDGKQDYLDDYILVAHWLLKQKQSGNAAGQKKKPAAVGK